tara:strand:- start:2533 stop:2961 length:429 start_codon:yes stop_codon:yes gene_type:complete
VAVGEKLLNEIGEYIGGKIKERLPVSSGKLAESLTYHIRAGLDNITIEGDMLFYWVNVEGGRKKGAKGVPIKALMDFIIQKGTAKDFTEAKPIAFAYQKKIIRDGIDPNPFMDKALQSATPHVETLMGKYVDIEIQQLLKQA